MAKRFVAKSVFGFILTVIQKRSFAKAIEETFNISDEMKVGKWFIPFP